MIYDVILIVIFLLMIIINAYRGAARALAGVLCSVIAYFAATALGKLLAVWIYDTMVRPAVDKAVVDAVTNAAQGTVQSVSDTLPAWIAALLKLNSVDLTTVVGQDISAGASAATTAVNNVVMPVAVSLLSLLATLILFLLIYVLLRHLAARPILALFEVPVLRGINRFFGGVIGLIDAFLLVSLLAYLLRLLMPAVSSYSTIFNESTIYNSFIFYHFYSGNIFTKLTSMIGI